MNFRIAVLGAACLMFQGVSLGAHEFAPDTEPGHSGDFNQPDQWAESTLPGPADEVIVMSGRTAIAKDSGDLKVGRLYLYSGGTGKVSQLDLVGGTHFALSKEPAELGFQSNFGVDLVGQYGSGARLTVRDGATLHAPGGLRMSSAKEHPQGDLDFIVSNGSSVSLGCLELSGNEQGTRQILLYNDAYLSIDPEPAVEQERSGSFVCSGKGDVVLRYDDDYKGLGKLSVAGNFRPEGVLALKIQIDHPNSAQIEQHPLIKVSGASTWQATDLASIELNGQPYQFGETLSSQDYSVVVDFADLDDDGVANDLLLRVTK